MICAGWSNAFVGLPWREQGSDRDGVWCWGLVALAYREVLGIEVPTYTSDVASTMEREEISAIMARDSARFPWARISGPERPLDIAMFRRGADPAHVGIVVRPGLMLHINREQTSQIESYRAGAWAPRLIGLFRHAEAATC